MNEIQTYRILFVNHIKDDLNSLLKIANKDLSLSIDPAITTKEAILFIDYHTYDLVIANIDTTGMELEQFVNYINQSFLNSKTPIVLHSKSKNDNLQNLRNIVFDIIEQPLSELNIIQILQFYFRQTIREKAKAAALHQEIHKRELLGLELEKSRENFQNIVEKSNVGILIVDQSGIIRFINEISQQIFLRHTEELIGSPFGLIFDDDKITEISIIRKNGEVGIGEISATKTQWKGEPCQLILINDITNHKKLQENLEIAIEKTQESDRLKTAFLANMSHEIRTPLNGILGFSQLMEKNDIDPEKKHFFLSSIFACGNHLLDIINDIIDIAQIESGQLKISKKEFYIKEVLNEVYEMFRIHSKIISNKIEFKFSTSDLLNFNIYSDQTRFRQILANLINNAIKFTEKGSIEVGVTIVDDDVLKFYVKDSGIGISESEHENIFKRFRQVSDTKERLNEGNGLGLSISKALVELLGGTISMESKIGEGSVFYFTIPLNPDNHKAVPIITYSKQSPNNEIKIKKILVVEDDEINFLFIQSIIKDMATTILWAKDGLEAVNIARRENVDLVLMDMKLPIMNGYEATKKIRLMFPNLPIIAQTAFAMGGDKDKVMAAGCNDYISKPIKINDLIYKMSAFFN